MKASPVLSNIKRILLTIIELPDQKQARNQQTSSLDEMPQKLWVRRT